MDNVYIAFGLTLLAGLSTGIGGLIALLTKTTNRSFLSVCLGFSAGIMIYISMIEIFQKARETLAYPYGEKMGTLITVLSFFAGILMMALIDKLIPSYENPHEIHAVEQMTDAYERQKWKLHRVGIFAAIAITIHNFPEGLATFISSLSNLKLGVAVAFAIAMHNIPEGISISVPVYFSTGSRRKAFRYSLLSGLTEPLGALIGYTILRPFINDTLFGIVFAAVAGIMIYISLDELLPAAREYGEHHLSIYGLIAGMAVMAISLLLFL